MDPRMTTVKIDADTHRLIADLAHVLGRTRKDIVRDAVHAFAAWRERALDEGLDEKSHRLALAGVRHETRLAAGKLGPRAGERVERSRIGAARMSVRVEAALSTAELLEHHRGEVEEAFAALGAFHPRFASDPRRYGHLIEHRVIVVDLEDPRRFDQSGLQVAAFDILALWCFVVPEEWASPA